VGAPVTRNPSKRTEKRWFNYYGPPYTLRSISLDTALNWSPTDTNFFRDKFVFVGGHPSAFASDQFATPYTGWGGALSTGVEILATGFLNLVRNDWLERISTSTQLVFVCIWGVVSVCGLLMLRPWHAGWVAVCGALGLASLSFHGHWHYRVWWSWLVPAAVQTPVALVWSIGCQYAFELRQRRKLRQAFSVYLSPHLADRIAQSDQDLALGGKVVEATVMFTDLEGFTALSEGLDPAAVASILTSYFNQTTRHILKHEGTIIKYMGDAVMAVWGAPLEEAKHAERAVLAACGMIESGKSRIEGRELRTRIGINTGMVLVGNLGSDFRFDYTAIGATTNLASRLEGLNKYLGTTILIGETTRRQLDDRFQTRDLGRFLVPGTTQPNRVFEVLGPMPGLSVAPEWLAAFDEALRCFSRQDAVQAETHFRRVLKLRDGRDGPAEFYLGYLENLRAGPGLLGNWGEAVEIHTK
jgi:adenylate cyclase